MAPRPVTVQVNQIPDAHPQPACNITIAVNVGGGPCCVLAWSYSTHRADLVSAALALLEQQDPSYADTLTHGCSDLATVQPQPHLHYAVAVDTGGLVAPLVFTTTVDRAELVARALRLAAEADPDYRDKVSQASLTDRSEGTFPRPL